MLEAPEVACLAGQLSEKVVGRQVQRVLPPTKPHKFCWFNGDPADYDGALAGARVVGAQGFGIYVEIGFEGGKYLCFNDGVIVRLTPTDQAAKDHQLRIDFGDGWALQFTVAMYGGIILHDGAYDNEYYLASRAAVSPYSDGFGQHFWQALDAAKPGLSAKAFLATQQRFPGLGNGCLQDILLHAGIHPRRKLDALSQGDRERLLNTTVSLLTKMRDAGGRDNERDLMGNPGGYPVGMDKRALIKGCPRCGGQVTKEQYLGGAVYVCAQCQPLG